MITSLPEKVDSLLRKSKRPVKFVLLRLPKDIDIKELDGSELDLTDLKMTSIGGDLSAIPDLVTNPDRASACPLFPDGENEIKCGKCFDATIQVVKGHQKNSKLDSTQGIKTQSSKLARVKDEVAKKTKRIKIQYESDRG